MVGDLLINLVGGELNEFFWAEGRGGEDPLMQTRMARGLKEEKEKEEKKKQSKPEQRNIQLGYCARNITTAKANGMLYKVILNVLNSNLRDLLLFQSRRGKSRSLLDFFPEHRIQQFDQCQEVGGGAGLGGCMSWKSQTD